MLEDRNIAQVSINMTDFTVTPLYRVTEHVRNEAARYGVPVIGTEVIGLCPMQALFDAAEYYLQIEDFKPEVQVIENHLLQDQEIYDYTAGQNLAVFFVERQFCESNLKYLKIHTFQWIDSMYDVNMI